MNSKIDTYNTEQFKKSNLLFKPIKDQVKRNYLYNIFNEKVNLDTQSIEKLKLDNITEDQINILSKYSVNTLSYYLYKDNQYIYFNNEALEDLEKIYQDFFIKLLKNHNRQKTIKSHHEKIKDFLITTNPFLKRINSNEEKMVKTFLCCEYSGEFQLNLFNIKFEDIIGPVLDIGCGEHANLVNFLNNNGIIATGIDRKITRRQHTIECDWFDYSFKEKEYGVIFSNNAFPIHFINSLNNNQNIPMYTRLFFRILNSLKEGGYFYYAPSIPFIEKYINDKEYTVSYIKVYNNFYMTKILKNESIDNKKKTFI